MPIMSRAKFADFNLQIIDNAYTHCNNSSLYFWFKARTKRTSLLSRLTIRSGRL